MSRGPQKRERPIWRESTTSTAVAVSTGGSGRGPRGQPQQGVRTDEPRRDPLGARGQRSPRACGRAGAACTDESRRARGTQADIEVIAGNGGRGRAPMRTTSSSSMLWIGSGQPGLNSAQGFLVVWRRLRAIPRQQERAATSTAGLSHSALVSTRRRRLRTPPRPMARRHASR